MEVDFTEDPQAALQHGLLKSLTSSLGNLI
jgi:hypothetical protein